MFFLSQAVRHRSQELDVRANTPRGAQASTIIYSIVETAKEKSLNPLLYLTYLFEKLPQRKGSRSARQASSVVKDVTPDLPRIQ